MAESGSVTAAADRRCGPTKAPAPAAPHRAPGLLPGRRRWRHPNGDEAVRPLVRYLLATQILNTARRFRDELRDAAPGAEGDLMTTYAEELIQITAAATC